jgi:hypothetical protein
VEEKTYQGGISLHLDPVARAFEGAVKLDSATTQLAGAVWPRNCDRRDHRHIHPAREPSLERSVRYTEPAQAT